MKAYRFKITLKNLMNFVILLSSIVLGICTLLILAESKHNNKSTNVVVHEEYTQHLLSQDVGSLYEELLSSIVDMNILQENSANIFHNSHQEVAKILEAEIKCYNATNSLESQMIINAAVNWLIERSDDNNDGIYGYGLTDAYDAFSDGTTNPENHTYGITNANVTVALLEAMKTDLITQSQKKEITQILKSICMSWCTNFFTSLDDDGYFWYSSSPNDNIETINVSAEIAGAFEMLISLYPSTFSESEICFVTNRLDMAVLRITRQCDMSFAMPQFPYIAGNNKSTNDLVHQVFILDGLSRYRLFGGRIELPYTNEQALLSIVDCWNADSATIMAYPISIYSVNRYARTFSTGSGIEFLSKNGQDELAFQFLTCVYRNYGDWPRILSTPKSENGTYDPRQVSFLLCGLAEYLF